MRLFWALLNIFLLVFPSLQEESMRLFLTLLALTDMLRRAFRNGMNYGIREDELLTPVIWRPVEAKK